MAPSLPSSLARSRATILIGLFVATLGLASWLVLDSFGLARAHRRSAERMERDFADLAAADLADAAAGRLEATYGDAMQPFAVRAYSANEPLRATWELLPRLGPPDDCELAHEDTTRVVFGLDFRSATVTTAGGAASAGMLAWIARHVSEDAKKQYRPGVRASIIFDAIEGQPRVVVYAVKAAEFGAPIAAYGVITCAGALGPIAAELTAGTPSITRMRQRGLVNARLAEPAAAKRADAEGTVTSARALDGIAGLVALVSFTPSNTGAMADDPSPQARLPVILGLLALTVALAVVALMQFRREHQLARLRADFTSSVSHEMRTPLAQILLFGETLQLGRARTDADRQMAAETIVQEARRLMHLVENVLRFARSERGTEPLSTRPLPLAALVRDVASRYTPLLDASQARIDLQVDDNLTVLADADAVQQIVLNVLDNAVKYGPVGQTVTVTVRARHDIAQILIDDEGAGIPLSDRERVWLPFVRGARTADSRSGGTGLGLAVVRELARALGGDARVESVGADHPGARFVIELPLVRSGEGA